MHHHICLPPVTLSLCVDRSTSSRLATIERDSFKAEAETNARELARARHEREDLVETIARLQLELRRQQERHDDNLIEKVAQSLAASYSFVRGWLRRRGATSQIFRAHPAQLLFRGLLEHQRN